MFDISANVSLNKQKKRENEDEELENTRARIIQQIELQKQQKTHSKTKLNWREQRKELRNPESANSTLAAGFESRVSLGGRSKT